TDVRLVSVRVFGGQRIRKIRIEDDSLAVLNDDKAALAQPPETRHAGSEGVLNIRDEGVVLLKGGFHWPEGVKPRNKPKTRKELDRKIRFSLGLQSQGI